MTQTSSTVSFEADIKPLFRASDDVASHATAIAARLKDGSMPCDGAWPPSQVTLFEAWVDGGLLP